MLSGQSYRPMQVTYAWWWGWRSERVHSGEVNTKGTQYRRRKQNTGTLNTDHKMHKTKGTQQWSEQNMYYATCRSAHGYHKQTHLCICVPCMFKQRSDCVGTIALWQRTIALEQLAAGTTFHSSCNLLCLRSATFLLQTMYRKINRVRRNGGYCPPICIVTNFWRWMNGTASSTTFIKPCH
jgi:hypothetical protein